MALTLEENDIHFCKRRSEREGERVTMNKGIRQTEANRQKHGQERERERRTVRQTETGAGQESQRAKVPA